MKLLFQGVFPEAALEKVLLANGFELHAAKRPPDKKSLDGQFDAVIIKPKTMSALEDLERWRLLLPDAWIAVVVEQKALRNSDFHSALLKHGAKDDVWVESMWELTFWLSLQRMLNARQTTEELKSLREEVNALQVNYDQLSVSSDRLIQQLEKDVGLAANIQRSLLPKISPEIPGVSLAVKYLPAAGLGGDYYDIFEFGDRKRYGVLMADSKTHGMAAALLSVLLKVRLEEMKDRFPDSKCFVEYINREFQQLDKKEIAPLSLLYGILDRSTLTFRYTVAGPLRPLLWRDGKPAELVIHGNPQLGTNAHFDFRENEIKLLPRDLLILHSDGLEAPLGEDNTSAFEKVVQVLRKRTSAPDPLEVQNELMALIDRYVEKKPLTDDLTLIHFAVSDRALYVAQAQ